MAEKERPQVKVRISRELKDWLDQKAKTDQRSLSFVVERAIEKAKKIEEMAA